ncbi:hypothetical protein [Myroides odoratimimus]|uniref:hypothetical protein n=1 Tax=Myroides odoratimimus TaxID=76832 RepID=UPI0025772C7D|nr:hypothetical protein [Myroides odoratimimus]MDM1453895.1 hypothetical protein [Myroides odoratimimus]MDM1477617.1 hypothetical protein [Myroides odoratimimus]MDM1490019.1 hypothetical protein [Myroides odoratimimus]
MKISTIRLSMSVIGQINQLKEKYELKNQAEAVELVFNFIEKYGVDVKRELVNNTLDNLLITMARVDKKTSELQQLLINLEKSSDKSNKTIVSMLRHNEKNYLVPILLERQSASNQIVENSSYIQTENKALFEDTIKNKEKEVLKLQNLVDQLQYEIKRKQVSIDEGQRDIEVTKRHLKALKSQFKRSSLTGKYSLSITEKEYHKL